MELDAPLRSRIEAILASDKVVLFMKGNRAMPSCGFSARVVGILDGLLDEYTTADVLRDPEIREGIKAFSDWPTLPQLYVAGEFVGGCDIVTQMHESGELEALLGIDRAPATPTIHIDERAAQELRAALADGDVDQGFIRIEIDGAFRHGLVTDTAGPRDVIVEGPGVRLVLDRGSARRADGLRISFTTAGGGGFRMDNPNAPSTVRQISVQELAAMLASKDSFVLVDVRTDEERAKACLPTSVALDAATIERIDGLPRDTPLVFMCHHGRRSQSAAATYLAQGFTHVSNVGGGIDAWSLEIDPSIPRY